MAKAAHKPPTKTEVYQAISDVTGLSKRDVSNVFDALSDQIKKAVSARGPGSFTIPGIMKIAVRRVPPTRQRQGINPFTGEPTVFKARPARNRVSIRPLVSLKSAAAASAAVIKIERRPSTRSTEKSRSSTPRPATQIKNKVAITVGGDAPLEIKNLYLRKIQEALVDAQRKHVS